MHLFDIPQHKFKGEGLLKHKLLNLYTHNINFVEISNLKTYIHKNILPPIHYLQVQIQHVETKIL